MAFYWWTHWFWITLLYVIATTECYPISALGGSIITERVYGKYVAPVRITEIETPSNDDILDNSIKTLNSNALAEVILSNRSNPSDIGTENNSGQGKQTKAPDDTGDTKKPPIKKMNMTETTKLIPQDKRIPLMNVSGAINSTTTKSTTLIRLNNVTLPSMEKTTVSNIVGTVNSLEETTEFGLLNYSSPVKDEDNNSSTTTTDSLEEDDLFANISDSTVDSSNVLKIRLKSKGETFNDRTRQSKVLNDDTSELKLENFTSETKNLLARSAAVAADEDTSFTEFEGVVNKKVRVLGFGAIAGICFSIVLIFGLVALVAVALYRRRYINKPQTLDEPDSSGYIDDSIIRDTSDEMYSLDNDSFLNSLEAMTIQNYWTDNVKHTKL